ncbi:MAG: ornithine carbamoyltransferase [Burkholderiaceae bacterium]
MEPIPRSAEPATLAAISPSDVAALVESARALQCGAAVGAPAQWLRGKKFALLCGADEAHSAEADLLERAAVALGARVAHIHPRLTELSTVQDVQQTAHMLGRLYDAVVCEGLAPALVQRLRVEAGVPVHDRILSTGQTVATTVGMQAVPGSAADHLRYVLQALLLKAIG